MPIIVKSNSRLNIIFTLWFLAVAIIPSLFVGIVLFNLHKNQAIKDANKQLAVAVRLKENAMVGFLEDQKAELEQIASRAANLSSLYDSSLIAMSVAINSRPLLAAESVYFVDASGIVQITGDIYRSSNIVWNPSGTFDASLYFEGEFAYISFADENTGGWLVEVIPQTQLREILYEDINDSKYFSDGNQGSDSYGLGRTADILLLNEQGQILVQPLVLEANLFDVISSSSITTWLTDSTEILELEKVAINGREEIIHGRLASSGNFSLAFVAMIDREEVLARLYDGERSAMAIYLVSLALVFVVLYLFVGNLSKLVIMPIYGSIAALKLSSERLKRSIDTTEDIMKSQDTVAMHLSEGYRDQVADIKAVDGEINKIVDSLNGISKQTRLAAKNVKLVDKQAVQGQKQAKKAQLSISSIKRLSTVNDMLLESLNNYSSMITGIASDVNKMSQAISYLSLNAGIEAGKPDISLRNLVGLVSEVGKLSKLSKDSSQRMNSLVKSIQVQLHQTKSTAADERGEAEKSLKVIKSALLSLGKISKEAIKIAGGVEAIDQMVSEQSSSTEEILTSSQDLTGKAKDILRQSRKVNALVVEQKASVRSNKNVVRKLVANITKMSDLIGSDKSKTNGKNKK